MTGKLVKIFWVLIVGIVRPPGKNDRPGARVHRRVLDRNDILDRIRVDFREALGVSHIALWDPIPAVTIQPGWAESLLVAEIGRIDHERIAVPSTSRISVQ